MKTVITPVLLLCLGLSVQILASVPARTYDDYYSGCAQRLAAESAKSDNWQHELSVRGLPETTLGINQRFHICVRGTDGCSFYTTGWRGIRGPILTQISEVIHFLEGFALDLEAYHGGLFVFHTVEFGPSALTGLKPGLALEGSRLIISVPSVPLLGLAPYTSHQIRRDWDAASFLPKRSREKRLWLLLNPVGQLRRAIRKTLGEAASHALERLRTTLLSVPTASAVRGLAEELGAVDRIPAPLRDRLIGLTDEDAHQVLEAWAAWLSEPQNLLRLEAEGILSAMSDDTERNFDVEATSWGVTIENIHNIAIRIAVGNLARHVGRNEQRPTLRVRTFGLLFNVSTHDNVVVSLDFTHSAESAGLATGLASLGHPAQSSP